MEKDITEETLSDEVQEVEQSDGDTAAVETQEPSGDIEQPKSLSLEEINSTLGKDFKDLDTALKSVKDTYSYVGKQKDNIKKEIIEETPEKVVDIDTTQYMSRADYNRERFYDKNPQYESYRDILGNDPAESLKKETIKKTVDNAIAYSENENSKSILHSNGKVVEKNSDYTKDMQRAQQTGNWAEFLEKHKSLN